jgi:Papain-like cysteine protease AvrRpt2
VESSRTSARPAKPERLSVPLHKQQASEWCWAAVSQGVALYFDPGSGLQQCQIVGRAFKRACCGDGFAPARDPSCNRQGYLHEALDSMGLLASPEAGAKKKWIEGPAPFEVIKREIDAGRPVCVLIRWKSGGGGHFIVIEGYSVSERGEASTWVRNPLSPRSSSRHPYDVLASDSDDGGFQDGQGRWAYTFLVQPPDPHAAEAKG